MFNDRPRISYNIMSIASVFDYDRKEYAHPFSILEFNTMSRTFDMWCLLRVIEMKHLTLGIHKLHFLSSHFY